MNNDIRNLTNYINTQKQPNVPIVSNSAPVYREQEQAARDNSLDYLAALGSVNRVNVGSNLKTILDEYEKDPDYAKAYIEFCDGLVESGYSLEEAICATDDVFNHLKNENLYKEE